MKKKRFTCERHAFRGFELKALWIVSLRPKYRRKRVYLCDLCLLEMLRKDQIASIRLNERTINHEQTCVVCD